MEPPGRKEPIIEGTILGSGTYGIVSAVRVGTKLRAIKTGVLTPLEKRISECGSRFIPKRIATTEGRFSGHLVTSLAPRKVEITPREALPIATFLCEALHDVSEKYSNPIVHGDIKPENIVLTRSGKPKLIDWGCATISGSIPSIPEGRMYRPMGTPGYIPPEGYDPGESINEKFDSWAIGITMYKLLSGDLFPFYDSEGNQASNFDFFVSSLSIDRSLETSFIEALDALPKNVDVPEEVYTVMKALLQINPDLRLSPRQAYILLKEIKASTPAAGAGAQLSLDPSSEIEELADKGKALLRLILGGVH